MDDAVGTEATRNQPTIRASASKQGMPTKS